jgi:peroxiredoxin
MNVKLFIHPKYFVPTTMALLCFFYCLETPSFAQIRMNQKPGVGDPAPDFNLSDIYGNQHRLSDYRGKVVLLNFWAKWCGPCLAEMPSMESLKNKLKDEKFVILTVSIDEVDLKSLKKFVEEKRYSLTVLHARYGRIQKRYNIGAIPTSFVIDKYGKVFSRINGAQKWDCPDAIQHLKSALMK